MVSLEKLQRNSIIPLIPNLPPKITPIPSLYSRILAFPSPTPRHSIQNQVALLPAFPSTSLSTGYISNEVERIRQLEIIIRNWINKLTLQERNNQGQKFKKFDNQYQLRFHLRNNQPEYLPVPKAIENTMTSLIESEVPFSMLALMTKWCPPCLAPHFLDSCAIYQHQHLGM